MFSHWGISYVAYHIISLLVNWGDVEVLTTGISVRVCWRWRMLVQYSADSKVDWLAIIDQSIDLLTTPIEKWPHIDRPTNWLANWLMTDWLTHSLTPDQQFSITVVCPLDPRPLSDPESQPVLQEGGLGNLAHRWEFAASLLGNQAWWVEHACVVQVLVQWLGHAQEVALARLDDLQRV